MPSYRGIMNFSSRALRATQMHGSAETKEHAQLHDEHVYGICVYSARAASNMMLAVSFYPILSMLS